MIGVLEGTWCMSEFRSQQGSGCWILNQIIMAILLNGLEGPTCFCNLKNINNVKEHKGSRDNTWNYIKNVNQINSHNWACNKCISNIDRILIVQKYRPLFSWLKIILFTGSIPFVILIWVHIIFGFFRLPYDSTYIPVRSNVRMQSCETKSTLPKMVRKLFEQV